MKKSTDKPSTSKRRYLSRSSWEKHVIAYREGNLTQPQYCQAHGLVLGTFRHWVAKLSRVQQPAGKTLQGNIIPMVVTPSKHPRAESASTLKIVLPNGIQCVFEVSEPFDTILPWVNELRTLS